MANQKKLEGQVELNCSAKKLFEQIMAKLPDIHNICTSKVAKIEVHEDACTCVGSVRRWDCIIGGKSQYFIERIEAVDEENMKIHRKVIDGEVMKNYKSLENNIQVVSKGDGNCIFVYSLEYEKVNEAAPEPHDVLEFALSVFKELAAHPSMVPN
ncbi:MLP-like protein 34 [Beta vulgaris subsp. vulgaris]|uniref:MLP-like protein 34 n=1 Tax=Beta vulgaris subsp. vulgaris TaxID=3555 RepID=UPI002036ABDE|nr:MLP-like protein 34 [Beta vulgaris subsp. vulgaris]